MKEWEGWEEVWWWVVAVLGPRVLREASSSKGSTKPACEKCGRKTYTYSMHEQVIWQYDMWHLRLARGP